MDFELTEDQVLFQRMLRDFVTKEIEPHAAEWDETQEFPFVTIEKMAELGLLAVHFPEEYGGSGDELTFALATDEISRGSGGLGAVYLAAVGLAMYPITLFGNDEQKRKYIPRLIGGKLAAFALTEASAGSDVAAMTTRYERRGDGYILNGSKLFITNCGKPDREGRGGIPDGPIGHRCQSHVCGRAGVGDRTGRFRCGGGLFEGAPPVRRGSGASAGDPVDDRRYGHRSGCGAPPDLPGGMAGR